MDNTSEEDDKKLKKYIADVKNKFNKIKNNEDFLNIFKNELGSWKESIFRDYVEITKTLEIFDNDIT